MLRGVYPAVVTTIAWRTMLRGACSSVVRTIALEEDAPCRLRHGGDDDPWRRMLAGFAGMVTTIALKDDAPPL